MTIIKSEFALALNQIASERSIPSSEIIASIEEAILAAYKKERPEEKGEDVKVTINKDTGEIKIFKKDKDITPPGFGRIATQTAKQVILQKIREVEKKTIVSQYQSQVGTIIRGRIIRFDGHSAYLDIGKTEAILPKNEQIPNEKYSPNLSLVVYIKEISTDKHGNSQIVVSRTHPGLVEQLFKREVPEIANETVKIKKVVRQPGERAKIAVFSKQKGIDPVGSCVGQKGVRVQTVTDELGGKEKIDIIQWNENEEIYLITALSPAKINKVEIDKKKKKAKVFVEKEQAPLAIGKGGVNVNLASKLTEYEIDIFQIESAPSTNQTPTPNKEKKETKDITTPTKDQ
ncbi:MAG: transcription termination factor NusA [Patescibacteria group bacterium]|nr:transcription termination factor NusA [Patescibacteria group bacterium]